MTDETNQEEGEEVPPRIATRLRSAPKIKQMFWCDFPTDAQLPEFWKTRPVIVISKNHTLSGVATVVPCTTLSQAGNKWAVELTTEFTDNCAGWAICDKITTVAVSRLSPHRIANIRVSDEEFSEILTRVANWLPLQTIEKS